MIDFQQVKRDFNITQVAGMLGLETKQDGHQLRASCPACNSGGSRAIVITPEKGVFYCFNAKKGGDLISLVSHIKGCSFKESAEYIVGKEPTPQVPPPVPEKKKGEENVLAPLTHLNYVDAGQLGFTAQLAESIGIGTCSKGLMKSHFAIPVRQPDGFLLGYIGVPIALMGELKKPKRWQA